MVILCPGYPYNLLCALWQASNTEGSSYGCGVCCYNVCQQCYDDIKKAGQKPAFEVGKACAVDVFHDGNFHAAEITVVQGDGKFTVKMRDGGLKGVTLETSLVSS